MAKKIVKQVKLQIPAGKANPAPPVGPVLGQAGVNIGDFVQKFNAATAEMVGDVIPVIISVYEDRSYDFVLKTPPVANLIMRAIGVEKGSGKPNTSKIGKITKDKIKEIAERKMPDLNAASLETAIKTVMGTARSMGVDVID